MESWSYVSDKKGFVTNELVSPTDSISRSKNAFLDLEFKTPYSYGNNVVVQNEQTIENQRFGDLGFFEMIRQPLPENSIRNDFWSSKDGGGRIINPSVGIQNAFSGYDSTSKLSSSVVESNCQDSLLIDLNLGRFVDNQDSQNYHQPSKMASVLSSAESSTPAKRVRVGGLNSQAPLCQVYGCNKDLRSSKDYHKRHKVCEVHSKTSKVIVNGIEQRFCQQCSRFHLLAEFDDGKRSCRKRLAGHNERRRKPQLARAGSLFPTFNGSRCEGTTLTRTSFICQDILPGGGLSHLEKYGTKDWCRRIKDEYETDYTPLSAIPITNGPMDSKSLLPPCFEKHFPTFHDKETITAPASIFSENSCRYPHLLGGPNSRSLSLVQDSSLGSEDFSVFNTASTGQRLSNVSDSGCALSLLSSQSQNSSYYSSGISMAHHLVMPSSNTHYSVSPISEKFMGVSSQAFMSGLSNKFPSSGMTSVDGDHLGPVLISEDSDAINFRIADGIFPGSDLVNAEDRLSCEDEPTIDLLQLSSQLQRVEHERQSRQAKKENNAFCCLRIT